MKKLHEFYQKTGLIPYDGELGVNLLSLQYEHLRRHIPFLYITICFYFILAAVFISSQVDSQDLAGVLASHILPIIVISFSLVRAFTWYKRRHDLFDAKIAAKTMISLTYISALIASMCGLWAVFAWQSENSAEKFYIPLIIAMGGFSVAYCLAIIPFSAMLNLFLALFPISCILFFSGEALLVVISITLITAMFYLMGLLRRHFAQMVNMTELQQQMQKQANTDMLTGLLNRWAFNDAYEKIQQYDREVTDHHISVAMIDLDKFKPINDRYGHATGDILLTMIAQRMRNEIDETCYIARIGGDEFAVIFYDQPIQYCREYLKKLSLKLSEPYHIGDNYHNVGISYGIAHDTIDNAELGILLSRADAALYRMKARKKLKKPAKMIKRKLQLI